MPTKNRFGFSIPDDLQNKINSLPRSVQLSPFLVRATSILCDELMRNPQLKPENIFIYIQEELPISEGKEGKKTAKKKA